MSSLLYGGDTAEGGSLEPLLSRLLRQSLDLFSIFIEALVSFLHSCACFLLASSSERASERAWWDTS